ncbi:hypothetical protein N7533_007920 [Penicillium manginii]|uniref:uncharacterized protein n=1 Tax=Penicillium manginii TaxID=203109 RepID=UPI002547D5BE|nr:uncharacterized protein N7533_007920 [Penicillium manginii]KAJ5750892.1 hypothetical protein N7533_007920 [Penicillium manginii]
MSDPFSVAGSAVGVISLGLQVCSTIVNYTQAVRGQNDNIQRLATKAEDIRSSLKNLRDLIEDTRDDSPGFASDLESKALVLEAQVKKLDSKVEQYKPLASESLHGKVRSTFKKAIYPLKKEAVFEIGSCLDEIQATVRTALAIFTARNVHKFRLKQDTVVIKQDQILEGVKTLQLCLTNSSPRTVLQQPPSLIKEVCDHLSDESWLASPPQSQGNYKAKQAKRRFTYYNRWLGLLVTGTFSLPAGSGGSSIAPFLRYSTVVGGNSWLGNLCTHEYSNKGYSNTRYGWQDVDYFIQQVQYAFSRGDAAPNDLLAYPEFSSFSKGPISILALPFFMEIPVCKNSQNVIKFIKSMFHYGSTFDYYSSCCVLQILCSEYILTEAALMLIPRIVERAGPIDWPPLSWIEKKNMQEILRRDEDSIDLPAAYIAVLRESYGDLQDIVKSNKGSLDRIIFGIAVPLLQLAMGWPAGVELLLEKSSSSELPGDYHHGWMGIITDEDSEMGQYAESCNVLFEAEYTFSITHTLRTGSSKLKILFLGEIAKRRKKLLEIAKAHICPSRLSEIRKGETGLPDTNAYRLCAALMAKGIKVDRFLRPIEGESVYSNLASEDFMPLGKSPEYSKSQNESFHILKKAHEFGFTDVDQQLPCGNTLLSIHCSSTPLPKYHLDLIAWLISKGADPLQALIPRSTTTLTHLISANMGQHIYIDFLWANDPDPTPFHQVEDRAPLHQIVNNLLSVRVTDACSCPCSVSGCTALSVAIRRVIGSFDYRAPYRAPEDIAEKAAAFRKFLQHLIEYNRSDSQPCRSIIRSLTFDGLGLAHSCCTEIDDHWNFRLRVRDQCDRFEIMEEQRDQFKPFESLVAEFEYQFETYGLPLMDFLQEVWYERMIRYISHRDPFDAEHHQELRKFNVILEMDDVEIPLVVQLICNHKRVIEDDSDDSRSGRSSSP